MLSFVACDKATGSEAPVTSGIITRTEEDKIYDLTEEEVKIIRLIDRSLYMYVNNRRHY